MVGPPTSPANLSSASDTDASAAPAAAAATTAGAGQTCCCDSCKERRCVCRDVLLCKCFLYCITMC